MEKINGKRVKWLQQIDNTAKPMPVDNGSIWHKELYGLLFFDDHISLVDCEGKQGVIPFIDIMLAKITEDVENRYLITLELREEQQNMPKFILQSQLFFLLFYSTMQQHKVPFHFDFTPARLQALGADNS
ncbi:hypothetical protein [Candidatus Uabimicrobium amorphum]|uniref:Uncharacterized protein n=1 Tax=Uabimicrobium amorphum TaxID=2596890 RepID=A0A5S9F4Z8_UABAM|nr:hypothetical protein [Candidatus Uabimicrobium amorphum]BBM86315.1 hypothetical protein UABAM_04701 [Candidatus Uabimicrobium amorphum]